jgi:hypothetical protein
MSRDLYSKYEEFKAKLDYKLASERKEFNCKLNIKNLKVCIYDELNQDILELINGNPSEEKIVKALICLETGLNSCLGKNNLETKPFSTEANFSAYKTPDNLWHISDIVIDINPKTEDPLIINKISNCLKFYSNFCTLKESNINLSIQILNKPI